MDYVLLRDAPVARPALPALASWAWLRATAAVVGSGALLAAGWCNHAARLQLSEGPSAAQPSRPFYPAEGLQAVLVRPGPPSSLALLPVRADRADLPNCLFAYGPVPTGDGETCSTLAHGAVVEEAWLYGARLYGCFGAGTWPYAVPSGELGDLNATGWWGSGEGGAHVVKGRLLCWPREQFAKVLAQTDHRQGFVPAAPEAGLLRRDIAKVVKRDGSTQHAYWYHQVMEGKEVCKVLHGQITVVLYKPRIPGNAGNVARTTFGLAAKLVLIDPFFKIDDKQIKRTSVGFWYELKPSIYSSWEEFKTQHCNATADGPLPSGQHVWFFTKFTDQTFFDAQFYPDPEHMQSRRNYLVFGSESSGLDGIDAKEFDQITSSKLRLPQLTETIRSHNLACSVAMGLTECERQRLVALRSKASP